MPIAPSHAPSGFAGPRLVVHLGAQRRAGLQWAEGEPITHVRPLQIDDNASELVDALRGYLRRHPYVVPRECAIETPPHDGQLPLAALCRELALQRVLLVQSVEAASLM